MSKDNNQGFQNPDYIPFPMGKKGKGGNNFDDNNARHTPVFNPGLEKALRDELDYGKTGSSNLARNLIGDTSMPGTKPESPKKAAAKTVVSDGPASARVTAEMPAVSRVTAEMPAVAGTASERSAAERPIAKNPVDKLIEEETQKDRFVPSHEAIVESVASYQDDDDKFESQALLSNKTGASRGVRRSPLKKDEAANASAKQDSSSPNPIKDEQAGKRFTVVLGALCLGLGIMLLIIYLFPPLVPIMGLSDKDAAKTPAPAVSGSPATPAVKPSVAATPAKPDPVKVYVVGAVKKPGVVSLPPNSRVDDAIKAAGGMTEDADPLTINLAKRIKDEDQIIVREKRQSSDTSSYDSQQYNWNSGSSYYDEPASQAPQEQAAPVSQAPAESIPIPAEVTKINLNGATSEELAKINGIGPVLSDAIIDYRTNLPGGYFSSLEQLKDVPGIGDNKYEILCQHVDL